MICHACRRRDHRECANRLKLGIALSTFCDCQHRDQAKVEEEAAQNQARIAAVVARRKPRPSVGK